MTSAERGILAIVSRLLEYPDDEYMEALANPRAFDLAEASEDARVALETFRKEALELGVSLLRRHYVEVFDHDAGASLHMTWHRYGNDRSQGRAMAALNGLYREAGLEPLKKSPPDYLPLMLEFLSVCDDWAALVLLDGFGPEIVKLLDNLRNAGSIHAPALALAIAPLMAAWPEKFAPRRGPDPTARPMASPAPEEISPKNFGEENWFN